MITRTPRDFPTITPTLYVSGGWNVTPGELFTLGSGGGIFYSYSAARPITAANVLYTIVTPPSHGTILLDGAPTSQFSADQQAAGRVTYQHDGSSAPTDSMQLWCIVTSTPHAVQPYAPSFTETFDTSTPGTTQGGIYAGVLLTGAGTQPTFDARGQNFSGSPHGVINITDFSTRYPSEAILVWTWSWLSGASFPTAIAVGSISYNGLTFTRAGGAVVNVINNTGGGTGSHSTVNAELWFAAAAAVQPSGTLTVTYSDPTLGSPSGNDSFACAASYQVADPTSPWGGISGALQVFATNTLPGSLSLTTTVNDQYVMPVAFEAITGPGPASPSPEYGPMGFSGITSGGEGGPPFIDAFLEHRTSAVYATINITVTGGVVEASLLALDNVVAYTAASADSELVFLDWSDDRGHSFGNPVGQPIGPRGDYETSVQYQRLGYSRDRVFRLTWSVPVATALLGAYIEVNTSAKS